MHSGGRLKPIRVTMFLMATMALTSQHGYGQDKRGSESRTVEAEIVHRIIKCRTTYIDYSRLTLTIPGIPAIVQPEVLNNKRHVLKNDTSGSVKLWEITKGVSFEDYGKVPFDKKKEELFEMVSIPAWFTVDTRLGYKPEDDKINFARENAERALGSLDEKTKASRDETYGKNIFGQ
ncbi:hypothetical protein KIW84_045557 [Lathyrus oleraceus]|uniref:Uncharacterized protein n=1 Tax=Pisum sativum TaxID=3888 RepID=A0A9D4XJA8_PEA|nr:hypothetical protein KIW84_045557 [Pisum sativum]